MFNEIKTEKDIGEFLEKTNELHDGHIISVTYTNNGIEKTENGYSYSPWKTTLTLRILVTSLWDTTVEIQFDGLHEWQIYDNFSGILATTLSFDDQGHIIWSDDAWQNREELKRCSFAVAASMKWRIAESRRG